MSEINRREATGRLASLAALFAAGGIHEARGAEPQRQTASPDLPPAHDMSAMPAHWHGNETIVFLIYPAMTALDMVGPHYMLTNLMGAKTYLVAKTKAPVKSDTGLVFVPDLGFDQCPREIDILCVPGGTTGTLEAMKDRDTIAFLADRGSRAKHVCSVCTGSLVLGAAGLLKGYRATSHWLARDLLKDFGAEPVDARVVVDRNRITGAGVTAGLDFGLSMLRQLRDDDYAKAVQLLAEYQPEPPLDAGTPQRAGPVITKLMTDMLTDFVAEVRTLARKG